MKKLLLAIVAAAMTLCASAAATTYTLSEYLGSTTISFTSCTLDEYTLSSEKGSASTAPAYNAAGDIRIYANGTLVVSTTGENMTKIVFNISTQGLKRLGSVTADCGEIAAQASGDTSVTWTGDAAEVVFTVGAAADYGSDGSSKAAQLCFNSITFGEDDTESSSLGYVLNVNDAEEFDGTYVDETSTAAARYQPLNSMVIGDFTFECDKADGTTNPAYYYIISTNTTATQCTLRIYKNNTLTISTELGNIVGISYTGNYTGTDVEFDGLGTSSVTFTNETGSNIQFYTFTITISIGEEEEYVEADPEPEFKYVASSSPLTGKCLIVFNNDGAYKYMTTVGADVTYTYGYGYLADVEVEDNTIVATEGVAWTITQVDEVYYTIQDTTGRYVYNAVKSDDTYYNSFNLSESLPEEDNDEYLYNISKLEDGTNNFQIVNKASGLVVSWDTSYSTIGIYESDSSNLKPSVFYLVDGTSGIEAAETVTEDDAPVVYYNLQGQRVMNPERGIFVRVQGTKASKVFL